MPQETLNEADNLDINTSETPETIETIEEDNSQTEEETTQQEDPKEIRWKQQLSGSKQEAERNRNLAIDLAYDAVSNDANKLLELHEKDPKLANAVAQKFGYKNYDDAKRSIQNPGQESKSLTEEDFERMYLERRAKEDHQRSLSLAETIIDKLPADLQEEAKEYFDEITEGKLLDETKAKKFAEMATLYVQKDKINSSRKDEALAKLASNWVSSTKSAPTREDMVAVIRDGKVVLVPNK